MSDQFREKQQKSYASTRMIYDITMSVIILGFAFLLFFGPRLQIQKIMEVDPLLRYMFGAICVLYGGFRLYRGIKKDYWHDR
jgi:uncharacterized membrane protein